VLLAAAGLPPGAVAAQTGFNGVITFQGNHSGGEQGTFVQTTKGHKIRIDGFGGDSSSMIVDNDAKIMMMVEPRKKQYMLVTQDDMKQMQAMMAPMLERMKQRQDTSKEGSFNFTKTGKTETVAGVPCEVYRGSYVDGEGKNSEGQACIATGVGFALADIMANNPMMQQSGQHAMMERYRQLVGGNKGILKATTIKDGKPTTEFQATKIEPKVVSDAVFAPPAGYKEVRLADMMMQAHGAMQKMQKEQAGKTPQ
jgi:hypothetical protein